MAAILAAVESGFQPAGVGAKRYRRFEESLWLWVNSRFFRVAGKPPPTAGPACHGGRSVTTEATKERREHKGKSIFAFFEFFCGKGNGREIFQRSVISVGLENFRDTRGFDAHSAGREARLYGSQGWLPPQGMIEHRHDDAVERTMFQKLRRWSAFLHLMPFFGAVWLCSCATTKREAAQVPMEPVRKVEFRKVAEMSEVAARARRVGNEFYPQVCALLGSEGATPPTQFDLIFQPLKSHNTGETHTDRSVIYINTDYLTNRANREENLDKLLVHELAHVAQQYARTGGFFFRKNGTCNGWQEGIADFVRYTLTGTNGWSCPQCNGAYPHYSSGYTCAGAFLLFLEEHHPERVVRPLNLALRRGDYTDKIFETATGKPLPELWSEFQQTALYTPMARHAFELETALGFQSGVPPRNFQARFDKHVKQHADKLTQRLLRSARLNGNGLADYRNRMVFYLYLTQPGGAPESFLFRLQQAGRLPGFAKGEHGWISENLSFEEMSSMAFPVSHTLRCQKRKEPNEILYTLERGSEDTIWKLSRAWQTGADGKVLREYDVTGATLPPEEKAATK